MSYTVNTTNLSSISLNESDTVKSVLQNIAIILKTPQQSVPLYREFGLPMQFVDKPMAAARPLLIAEIREAISTFEPRATVLNVSFESDERGSLVPTVEVEIHE